MLIASAVFAIMSRMAVLSEVFNRTVVPRRKYPLLGAVHPLGKVDCEFDGFKAHLKARPGLKKLVEDEEAVDEKVWFSRALHSI